MPIPCESRIPSNMRTPWKECYEHPAESFGLEKSKLESVTRHRVSSASDSSGNPRTSPDTTRAFVQTRAPDLRIPREKPQRTLNPAPLLVPQQVEHKKIESVAPRSNAGTKHIETSPVLVWRRCSSPPGRRVAEVNIRVEKGGFLSDECLSVAPQSGRGRDDNMVAANSSIPSLSNPLSCLVANDYGFVSDGLHHTIPHHTIPYHTAEEGY